MSAASPPQGAGDGGEGGAAGGAMEMERLGAALVAGGDTRCEVVPSTGNNAYHCPPLPVEGQIIRGSCTGSPPCQAGVDGALAEMRRLEEAAGGARGSSAVDDDDDDAAFEDAMERVRVRLAAALGLPKGTGVFLSASGTDAEYIPLAIAQQLYPGAPIRSVLAADGETGSGGTNACKGKYFDKRVPLAGAEEGDEDREVGATLGGFPEIAQLCVPAREADGAIRDVRAAVDSHASAWGADGADGGEAPVWVMRQVLGTKTGFSTPRIDAAEGERVIAVADLCQMRQPASVVRAALDDGACALITGSKFFQGSAFSAATVVPPELMAALAASASAAGTPPLPPGMRDFFSRYEVPRELPHWRAQLGATANMGLLMRWHTALPLVEGVYALGEGEREQIEAAWTERVVRLVEAADDIDVVHTEVGIVSIALRKADGARCGRDELRLVHRHLATDASALPGSEGCADIATRCFIGQPVGFTSDYAVLRIAIGAEAVLEMAGGNDEADADATVVRKLEWLLRNLDELK